MPRPPNRTLRVLVPLAVILIAGGGIFYAVLRNSRPSSQTGAPPAPVQTQAPLASLTDGKAPPPDAPPPTPANPAAVTPPSPPATPAQAAGVPTPTNPTGAPAQTAAGATATAPGATPAATTAPQPGAAAPVPAAPTAVNYRARVYDFSGYDAIGSLTPKDAGGTREMEVRFHPGGGVASIKLANHFTSSRRTEHETVQAFTPLPGNVNLGLLPFALDKVEINGKGVALGTIVTGTGITHTVWRQTAPGRFEATVVDDQDAEVLRITRTFSVDAAPSYELTIRQTVENLSGAPLGVRVTQMGPVDHPLSVIHYGGDQRRVRFGYLPPPDPNDPGPRIPRADEFILDHRSVLGSADEGSGLAARWKPKTLWPTPLVNQQKLSLAWAATTGRYFAAVAHPVGGAAGPAAGGQAAATPAEPLLTGVVETVERIAIPWDKSSAPGERAPDGVNGLRFTSPALTLAPGGSADLSMQVYAGPMSREAIAADPAAARVGLDALLYYSLGGPCAFCTFQTLAQFLRSFLGALEGYVTHDWALAVMLLVVCVRTILHPVTRWSQTSLYRFSKQMSRVAPKQKAIQEKYKNDPQRLREELMRLNREEGVSYAGALGCVPMFLQTPVWIALYAMIFFTFALRHEAAFFGLFQHLTGGKWAFLSDLAEPDNFVNFHDAFGGPADGYYVPLLSSMMGPIQGINIIPLILGVVFYIQQKYLTPPPTTTLTPEQEQQQKIMKVVSVVMFPLFMYNAPAALSLYFMTNSTLGILESKWIRHHAEEADKRREAENAVRARSVGTSMLDRKGQPKKEGFLDKLQRMALEAQQMREQQQRGQGKKK